MFVLEVKLANVLSKIEGLVIAKVLSQFGEVDHYVGEFEVAMHHIC